VQSPAATDAPALPARDKLILFAALTALVALAWAYLWLAPMPMPATSGGLRTLDYLVLTFLMWFVMMVGMMVPSVVPTVLLFDRVARRGSQQGMLGRTVPFVLGYLTAWLGFSVIATLAQVELIAAGWIDDMGVSTQPLTTAAVLLGIGIYQWLPAKRACLGHCQGPVQYLVSAYRPGASGAWRMGLGHGLYCLGCCWTLMLLLFIGGVMNLLWVAVIAGVVFVEKLLARVQWLRPAIGIVALVGGLAFGTTHFT
jgi:predicted metal-binding membrane protein